MANNRRLTDLMRAYERGIITRALQETSGNVAAAARLLGCLDRNMWARIARLEIDVKKYRKSLTGVGE